MDKVIKNDWFRVVLLNFIDINLYEHQVNEIYKDHFYSTTARFRKELYDNIIEAYKRNVKEVNITSGKDKVDIFVAMPTRVTESKDGKRNIQSYALR